MYSFFKQKTNFTASKLHKRIVLVFALKILKKITKTFEQGCQSSLYSYYLCFEIPQAGLEALGLVCYSDPMPSIRMATYGGLLIWATRRLDFLSDDYVLLNQLGNNTMI